MSNIRKVVPHNAVYFVTTSVEEDLLLTLNPLISLIITSCMARANYLYPVKICDFVIQATHIHFIMVVSNPDDLRGFMERFKTESAHAINRLLGRKKRTVWCEGYDSPVILDPLKVVEKTAYLYTNPARDGLVDSISNKLEYGMNSWSHLTSEKDTTLIPTKIFKRRDFVPLPERELTYGDYCEISQELAAGKADAELKIYGIQYWLELFEIREPEAVKHYRDMIINTVLGIEEEQRIARELAGKKVIGVKKLRKARPGTPYRSTRRGRRTFCLSSSKSLRQMFIRHVKSLIEQGKEILRRWRLGDFSKTYPLGLYPPSLPKACYPISWPGFC